MVGRLWETPSWVFCSEIKEEPAEPAYNSGWLFGGGVIDLGNLRQRLEGKSCRFKPPSLHPPVISPSQNVLPKHWVEAQRGGVRLENVCVG